MQKKSKAQTAMEKIRGYRPPSLRQIKEQLADEYGVKTSETALCRIQQGKLEANSDIEYALVQLARTMK